jgi:chemotaxis protein histidine kinase CheA
MADEVVTETNEINELVIDSDDKMFAYAMENLKDIGNENEEVKEETVVEDKPEDQSAVEEVKEETAEEIKAEPQAEEKADEKKPEPDTAKPETKPHYTLDEIKEIAKTGDFSQFDVSRLTPGEVAALKSMQAGFTPKLQEAAELRKERDTLIQRIRAEETKKAQEEAEKKYQEEKEQYGEEMANLFKKVRDLETAQETAKADRERERQAFLAQQQQVAAQQYHYTFIEKAKEFGIPATPQWEEMCMARTLAENQARALNNEPFISVEDGMRMVSDAAIIKDIDALDKLLIANPILKEALRNRFSQEAVKAKPAAPTVIKSSSSGGSGKSEVKRTTAPHDKLLDKDMSEWMVQEALAMAQNPNQ